MQATREEKGFHTPRKQDGVMLIRTGQRRTCFFSKFVPLRQLFDNHYTVGTEISTLSQTEHQIAAATLETRFAFVNGVRTETSSRL